MAVDIKVQAGEPGVRYYYITGDIRSDTSDKLNRHVSQSPLVSAHSGQRQGNVIFLELHLVSVAYESKVDELVHEFFNPPRHAVIAAGLQH